ncbi:uncharacterized protein N7529_004797 [Penicillium soppii]|jgi:small subunit ribosomal protein S11|uniref:uncharacterized protein n=1 Tax=Penicillium soppii TaxID=69789 RepID=UPI002547D8DC|nr:uncharacterized protein N7529_004797 [Penicillium soppii]KAJ5872444.1 hypothetical protein N7529_004797 [Penicillium soppii]
MSSLSLSALAKALPSVCRQSQPRIASLGITRPFSVSSFQQDSGRSTREAERDSKKSDMERQILNREPETSSDYSSPLSAITRMMQGDRSGSPAARSGSEYSRMAESLESDLIKNPYADRAPPHHLHVYCHKHNTIITLTRPNGNPLLSLGCGQIGFRKAGRSGFDPAYQLSAHVMSQIQEKGFLMDIERLEIVFRGFGKGREAFTKVLLGNEGKLLRGLVARVTDSTRLKFGGTRSRHERRLG